MPGLALPILLALAAGVSVTVQQVLNSNLRTALSSAAWSGFVSYLVGVVCMALLALALRDPVPSAGVAARIPWWAWSDGLFGAIFIGLAILLVPHLGAATFIALLVTGQMLASSLGGLRPLRLARPRPAPARRAAPDRRGAADRGCGPDPALRPVGRFSRAPFSTTQRSQAMHRTSAMFRGLSAFPITPADPRGQVDTGALVRLVQRLAAAEVDSIGLLGSTGTYAYLSRAERRRAVEAAAGCLGGRVPLIVGVGALRTDDAQDLARDAKAAGADGLLLAPVSYTPLTEEEVFEHFVAVARSTDLPLCIYNNPATTHFTFGDALLERLAQVPNIAAVKNPAPPPAEARARHEALRVRVPGSFAIGYSGDPRAADAVLAGGEAWYSVIGGLLPMPTLKLLRAAQAGDEAGVARWNARLRPLWDLFEELSSLRVVYAAADILGICHTEPPRPILPLPSAAHRRVAAALEMLDGDDR